MKTIKVVAAVICDNIKEKNKIFATARGYGELKGGWEFPGGKIEEGETPQEALKREILEETKILFPKGYRYEDVEFTYKLVPHLNKISFFVNEKRNSATAKFPSL